jgi:hypothetical protein
MYRLYFDTCILNDFFALLQYELGEKVRNKDIKAPIARWTPEYVALYYILNLDDQWELEFGTSEATLQEIRRFHPNGQIASEKKTFLEEVYHELSQNWQLDSGLFPRELARRINELFGPGYDSLHLCLAIYNRWDFFLTTDFKTILDNHYAVRKLESLIKIQSPLQFLEENLLPLPTLIRTLHGSWTNPNEFIGRFGLGLSQLNRK